MSSEELYYNFQLVLNKNASQKNVQIPRGNFVAHYNRESNRWLEDYIKKNNSVDRINNVQGLITVNAPLSLAIKKEETYYYDLPNEYFEFINSRSSVLKGKCNKYVINYLTHPKETLVSLDNETPSFEFEESVCNIAENKLQVFTKDYKINNTYLSYYHKPSKIDLSGYQNINGENSITIDSELDDRYQHEIIDRMVTEIMREFENSNGFKFSQERQQKN